ncbi:MAG: PHB depolymerase family esterase [Verrucomicrobiota bacterium]
MKLPAAILFFTVILSFPAIASEAVQIKVGALERSFLLHLPEGHSAERDDLYPVVINFHGGGGNAEAMERMSGMNQLADREGFIVVYPNGTGRLRNRLTFNGGECCGYAEQAGIDDVGFVGAILDELEAKYGSDPKRVYLTGLSNGGIVSHHVAAKLAGRITAIAPVGGTLEMGAISPSRPVPVMHIHGTADLFLPEKGGFGVRRTNEFRSVDHTLRTWITANNAGIVPTVENLPDSAEDGCTVERITYPAREDGMSAEVIYIRIKNGGHTWPGSENSPTMLGKGCRDIDANELMWEFFQRHSLDG